MTIREWWLFYSKEILAFTIVTAIIGIVVGVFGMAFYQWYAETQCLNQGYISAKIGMDMTIHCIKSPDGHNIWSVPLSVLTH